MDDKADGLWVPYSRRRPRVHQPRYRRDCLGELVQIDGSPHDWFEGRAPKCCLLVFIDDATGRLMHLRFGETESAFDYMMATPRVSRATRRPLRSTAISTAFSGSIMEDPLRPSHPVWPCTFLNFGIELICANSPQAKGRVERANQTLQDRLIKEMRLEGICSIEAANAGWIPSSLTSIVASQDQQNTPKIHHRPVSEKQRRAG